LNQSPATQKDQIPKAFAELMDDKTVFPMVLEGKNLPLHESTVVSIDTKKMQTVIKTLRPLPVQLPSGTLSLVSISALGEHWKVRLVYKGRAGYLQYLFDLPSTMEQVGRREYKRYPFRPRENVSVYVQDSTLPGIASMGLLLDLSIGGMVFRPERAFIAENKIAIKLDKALFNKGKRFPLIRISGLPGLKEPIQLRGEVVHAFDRGRDFFVAFAFGLVESSTIETLSEILSARD